MDRVQVPLVPLIRSETENCIERGGFTRAVGTDESEDSSFFNAQIDAVECYSCAESFAETVGFYRGHRFSDCPFCLNCALRHRAIPLDSAQAAEWLRVRWANARKEISDARL